MSWTFKLFFKYLLWRSEYGLVNNAHQRDKMSNLLITPQALYYVCTHFKLSSIFYSTQLCDMLAYEVVGQTRSTTNFGEVATQSTLLVYNFHSMLTQQRFFMFVQLAPLPHTLTSPMSTKYLITSSVAELFPAANWLEREIAELHGISFTGKKDLRNLMLQYGDTSAPLQKLYPSIGLKELVYNPIKDTIIQTTVTLQL